MQLHAVDLGDLAGVRAEPLGDGLREPLGELAHVGGDERDPAELRGSLAVAGAAVERLGGAALLGDVADLGLQGDGAAALVADEGHGHLSQHVRAVGLPVALLDRVVRHLTGEQRLVQAALDEHVLGLAEVGDVLAHDVGDLPAQELRERRIDVEHRHVEVGERHRRRRVLEDAAEALLGDAQRGGGGAEERAGACARGPEEMGGRRHVRDP